MTHLTALIESQKGPVHTYEFFPPRTEQGFTNLLDRIRRLTLPPLRPPVAVSVTWGAGGSTSDRSLELADAITKMGVEVILHLTCTNMPKEKVDTALAELGITNILALRGDAPRSDEYATDADANMDEFQHADDLVRYIRKQYGDYFCIGVAGYPTPHPDSLDADDDLKWLKEKCDAGADYIITQLFYDVPAFADWVQRCRQAGIAQPIIPGIMPIQSYSSFRRLINLTKCTVPDYIMQELEPIKTNDAAVKQYGASLATEMVKKLMASKLVPGVHFCTLNLEKSVRTILENLQWNSKKVHDSIHSSPVSRHNQLISEEALEMDDGEEKVPLAVSAADVAQWVKNTREHTAVGGEPSWDEFPNGRFTDVRSPAYGEIDGWGNGLKITPAQALKEWGTPATFEDLSDMFTRYLRSDPGTPTTPFCDMPLSPESQTILDSLIALNAPDKRYWTVGSQPAVDAARSEDPVHGWGPPGGYVFQKAYVEFFVPKSEVERLEKKLAGEKSTLFSMYAANRQGDTAGNTDKESVNAVTWAAFPGQEIVQSTIIEELSFLAWKEEAFEIWDEWARLYPRNSPARKLIENVSDEWWLVCLIHHNYKDTEGLWRFLLDN
ncbi:methylenetetrahydrofolate reductase (NADPH) [Trichosporon asahii var. asahii CBS 8904]|uniref:Methylenetetrahydrofolate reductase (NADPH) n=2 Tax=Trichosporon asahii var. asahii TaxID=189963 RepID=K1WUF3_TRIAC|nr:methylenetetrahydrofolate reductase (NADPH) [Trichosporon asahii var. asahii CBS 2479]EJT46462.1 methylenetetrahydrofolate reductase (NADPH) [Trichosporon asahii var. asahii CBS 2479]EKD04524.1 methylenetetrahydrofolate reductase (NADPH) [Trichosporon asahii var. asahii CBS 8904]